MINNYELGLASKNDYEGIVEFIQAEYKKNHIITRDEILFRREYEDDKNLNFILAKDKNNKITGCLGYMKSNSKYMPDIWKPYSHTPCTERAEPQDRGARARNGI